jgi:hypothetical protein
MEGRREEGGKKERRGRTRCGEGRGRREGRGGREREKRLISHRSASNELLLTTSALERVINVWHVPNRKKVATINVEQGVTAVGWHPVSIFYFKILFGFPNLYDFILEIPHFENLAFPSNILA